MAAPGSRSDGLRIRVFPVVAAIGMVQRGIILQKHKYILLFWAKSEVTDAGKLNGAILAQTPKGSLRTSVSMSLLTKKNKKKCQRPAHSMRVSTLTFQLLAYQCCRNACRSFYDLQPAK